MGAGFCTATRRISANFSGIQRILESPIRIPANLSGIQRTQYHIAVNRKVAGSSPASGANSEIDQM
jgi:hypothetical protein